MDKKELDFILQKGGGLKIEFKEGKIGIDKDITAFSNASGGRIFVGIDDNSKIKGVEKPNKLKSQIQTIARNCDPVIEVKINRFENILIVEVEEGRDKPYRCKEGFYMRIGSNSQKMGRDEIIEFAIKQGKLRFDKKINNDFNFEKEFDESKLDNYLKFAEMTKNIDVKNIIINLGIGINEGEKLKFNNTGLLFFAKKPERFFLTSKVVCANYQTDEKVKILDKKIFDDGIINNIKEAIDYVQKHINIEYKIKKLEREEIPQYPEEAIRECIVNAIMHRDYFDASGDILIEVFRNKVVISNPGGLIKSLSPKNFGKESRTRNPIIANLLANTVYVEKLGTGINRIRDEMKKAGLPEPEFDFNGSFFVTLYDKSYLKERVGERVGENERKILELISKDKYITYIELATKLGITEKSIYINIEKLKQKNLLKRIGPAKGGYWEVREEWN